MVEKYRDYRVLSKRMQILEGAHSIIKYSGVRRFTMDQLADYLEISKGSIYNYFNDKEELLTEVASRALNYLQQDWQHIIDGQENAERKLHELFMTCYKSYKKYTAYFELILFLERPEFKVSSKSFSTSSTNLAKLFENFIDEQQKNGSINNELGPKTVYYTFRASCAGVLNFIHIQNQKERGGTHLKDDLLMNSFADLMVAGLTK